MPDRSGDTEWVVKDCDTETARVISQETCVPELVGKLLVNRGITAPSEAHDFLHPHLDQLHDPALLPDFERAARRLKDAIESKEKICVFGDYDVDGVTSTAMAVRALAALGADVEYRLPHRKNDGYDIKERDVEEIAQGGASVIMTCDCGTSARDAATSAAAMGIDLLITDHHEPGSTLPDSYALVNPKRPDSLYPFRDLAGVGVVFKFMQGLTREMGYNERAFIDRFTDLAALGTVSDVAPLLGENRAIVKHGIEAIPATRKVGFRSLLESTRLAGKTITSYSLAYVLGPRINAVGRMDDAESALRLFLTKDKDEAGRLAAEMERHNDARKAEQERIFNEAVCIAESKDLDGIRVLVMAAPGWNSGVIGIVAGKICEVYGRPAILFSADEETGFGHGSARSIPGFHFLDALRSCGDIMGRYGGHALAAGASIPLENIDLLEERLNEYAAQILEIEELVPRIDVEAYVEPEDIDADLAKAIEMLQPFGESNPEPLLMTSNLAVIDRRKVGDGTHLKLRLRGENAEPVDCIAFRMGDLYDRLQLGECVDVCYSIRLNSYNGFQNAQLAAHAIRPTRR